MIVEINKHNINDVNKASQPFEIIGKIVPSYQNGIWSYTEQIYDKPYIKEYDVDENEPYESYIGNPSQTIFFYYDDNACVGQIIVRKYWNKYAYIHKEYLADENHHDIASTTFN